MTLPIYELKISENLDDESQVSAIALVDEPAIKRTFQIFTDEFINPSKGEHEKDFIERCIKYVINEGKDSEQAFAICNSLWKEHFVGGVSFDYDGVLTTSRGIDLLDVSVSRGTNVYIISARHDDAGLKEFASKHGVKLSNVFATGSNKAKIEKVKQLDVSKHYDNNSDVINQLGSIGEKFASHQSFQIVNEDEHIVTGCLMESDLLIYRNNETMGEHYVKFSAETIKQISIKWAKQKFQTNVNLMHDSNQSVKNVTMFESWLVDKKRGVQPMKGFEDVADGSWFGSFYVENPEVWQQLKDGTFRGFSVEGLFDYTPPISAEENALKTISKLLNDIIED
jgi:hypothetical protein